MNKVKTIILKSPSRGYVETLARSDQPPDTSPECINMLPFDRDFRRNVSKRPGTLAYTVGTNVLGPGTTPYCLVQSASGANKSIIKVTGTRQACTDGAGYIYYLRGGVIYRADYDGANDGTLTGKPGRAGTVPTGCTWLCMWRGSLVCGGPDHNWYKSANGNPLDWDYTVTTYGHAVFSNQSYSFMPGALDTPTICGTAFSEDILIIFGDRRIWKIQGEPTDGGGSYMLLEAALTTPRAWTFDPEGNLWFATTSGLYKFNGVTAEPIAQNSIPAWFQYFNRSTMYLSLVWDRDRHGLWMFSTMGAIASHPVYATNTHFFYDADGGGFWPTQFTGTFNAIHHAVIYDANAPNDRQIVYVDDGGFTTQLSSRATGGGGTYPFSDRDGAFESTCYLWPVQPFGPDRNAMLINASVVMGELPIGLVAGSWYAEVFFSCGDDYFESLNDNSDQEATYAYSGTAGQGRQANVSPRITGNVFSVLLLNSGTENLGGAVTTNNTFSFDSVSLQFVDGGLHR